MKKSALFLSMAMGAVGCGSSDDLGSSGSDLTEGDVSFSLAAGVYDRDSGSAALRLTKEEGLSLYTWSMEGRANAASQADALGLSTADVEAGDGCSLTVVQKQEDIVDVTASEGCTDALSFAGRYFLRAPNALVGAYEGRGHRVEVTADDASSVTIAVDGGEPVEAVLGGAGVEATANLKACALGVGLDAFGRQIGLVAGEGCDETLSGVYRAAD